MKPTVISSRCLKHIDLAAFNFDLSLVDLGEVFTAPSVCDQWTAFLARFLPIVDFHAPLKRVTIRNPTTHPVSPATRDLMSRRRAALAHSGHDSAEYRDINRAVRSAVRRDRRQDIERDIGDRGPSRVWQCIRAVVAGKRDGKSVRPDVSADEMNEFFVSVGPGVAAEIGARGTVPVTETRLPRVGACSFELSPVTREMLGHTVFSMRSSAACGADGVCIRMLRAGFPAIGDLILYIDNTCLTLLVAGSWLPLLVAGGLFRTPLDISGSYRSIFKFKRHSIHLKMIYISKKKKSKIRRRGIRGQKP